MASCLLGRPDGMLTLAYLLPFRHAYLGVLAAFEKFRMVALRFLVGDF